MAVRLTILFPAGESRRFDLDYYLDRHMALAAEKWGDEWQGYEVDTGLGGAAPGSPAPYVAITHIYFPDVASAGRALSAHGREVAADVVNFTDATPVVQLGEIHVARRTTA